MASKRQYSITVKAGQVFRGRIKFEVDYCNVGIIIIQGHPTDDGFLPNAVLSYLECFLSSVD